MSLVTFMSPAQAAQFSAIQSRKIGVFEGFTASNWSCVASCLGSRIETFKRKELILSTSATPDMVGVIIRGVALERTVHADGSSVLVGVLESGDIFGEAAIGSITHDAPSEVSGATDGEAIIFSARQINNRNAQCPARTLLVENLMHALVHKQQSTKNMREIVSHRTLKDRILAYLSLLVTRQGSSHVRSILSRSELAELLAADRSAFSRELHRLRHEGRIDIAGDVFSVHS